MTYWGIFDASGKLVGQVISETHPCDPVDGGTAAYDVPRDRVVKLARRGDLEVEDPQPDGTWTLNLERYKARLLNQIDTQRGRLVRGDERKQYAHVRKGAEAERLLGFATADLEAMAASELATRFPWLSAEAQARGSDVTVSTLSALATGVREAMIESEAIASQNEALAIVAKAAIRAASNRGEVDAAADVNWIV